MKLWSVLHLVVYLIATILFKNNSCEAFSVASCSRCTYQATRCCSDSPLSSSFFGDFEKFDNEGDDDDDDEDDYDSIDDKSIEDFRSRMGSMFGSEEGGAEASGDSDDATLSSVDELIDFARSKGDTKEVDTDWAKHTSKIEAGVVLVANPKYFCDSGETSMLGLGKKSVSKTLLSKFGLSVAPPKELGPDRRADLMPVLALVEQNDTRGSRAVLLNRRTGYLLGDLEQPPPGAGEDAASVAPLLEKFCIQPLWFGGIDNISSGLDMLHLCPAVPGATKITEDGLYWGGNPEEAQDAMEDPSLDRIMSGFDFKFFVQSTLWSPNELAREIEDGTWFVAEVSKEVLFKSRDRMGTRRAKPLWTEIMELMGGKFKDIRDDFYNESE